MAEEDCPCDVTERQLPYFNMPSLCILGQVERQKGHGFHAPLYVYDLRLGEKIVTGNF